jgi:protein transport protein SEC61 subunit alpha
MTFRILNLVRPFLSVLPDVQRPDKRVPFYRKAIYTVVSLLIYLICSRLPLYGIRTSASADPMYWARVIFASSRGTTMELGISPVVTSGLVIQLLVGSKLLDIDMNVKSDVELMCVLRAIVQALSGSAKLPLRRPSRRCS